jgi:hypothetical protein
VKLARLSLAALLPFALILVQPAAGIDGKGQAAQLLRTSYQTARNLPPEDRLDFLVRLTRTAADLGVEDTRPWAKELFALSSSSTLTLTDWTRLSAQKNALVALSVVSPEEAFKSFSSIASQPHPADRKGKFPEDLRADASILIFSRFWHKVGEASLHQIGDQADLIGASGEYPYRAVGLIIEDLGKIDNPAARNEATALFSDAVRFYPPKGAFANANEEFLALLKSAQGNVSGDVYGQGLQAFVKHVTPGGPLDSTHASEENYQADVYTANALFRFADKNRYMLFRVFPLIAQFDSSWADKLKGEYKELSYAGDEIQHVEQGVINGTSTQALQEQLGREMEANAAIARIQQLQQDNPWAALELAKGIPAPEDRMRGLSYVVPGMVNVDPLQARKIFSQELQLIDDVADPAKLSSSVALAKTAYYLKDVNTFTDSALKAFQDGTKLFSNDAKKRAFERGGFEELQDLVEFSTEHGVNWVVGHISHVKDPLLSSYLLMFAAQGAARNRSFEPPALENRPDIVTAAVK